MLAAIGTIGAVFTAADVDFNVDGNLWRGRWTIVVVADAWIWMEGPRAMGRCWTAGVTRRGCECGRRALADCGGSEGC